MAAPTGRKFPKVPNDQKPRQQPFGRQIGRKFSAEDKQAGPPLHTVVRPQSAHRGSHLADGRSIVRGNPLLQGVSCTGRKAEVQVRAVHILEQALAKSIADPDRFLDAEVLSRTLAATLKDARAGLAGGDARLRQTFEAIRCSLNLCRQISISSQQAVAVLSRCKAVYDYLGESYKLALRDPFTDEERLQSDYDIAKAALHKAQRFELSHASLGQSLADQIASIGLGAAPVCPASHAMAVVPAPSVAGLLDDGSLVRCHKCQNVEMQGTLNTDARHDARPWWRCRVCHNPWYLCASCAADTLARNSLSKLRQLLPAKTWNGTLDNLRELVDCLEHDRMPPWGEEALAQSLSESCSITQSSRTLSFRTATDLQEGARQISGEVLSMSALDDAELPPTCPASGSKQVPNLFPSEGAIIEEPLDFRPISAMPTRPLPSDAGTDAISACDSQAGPTCDEWMEAWPNPLGAWKQVAQDKAQAPHHEGKVQVNPGSSTRRPSSGKGLWRARKLTLAPDAEQIVQSRSRPSTARPQTAERVKVRAASARRCRESQEAHTIAAGFVQQLVPDANVRARPSCVDPARCQARAAGNIKYSVTPKQPFHGPGQFDDAVYQACTTAWASRLESTKPTRELVNHKDGSQACKPQDIVRAGSVEGSSHLSQPQGQQSALEFVSDPQNVSFAASDVRKLSEMDVSETSRLGERHFHLRGLKGWLQEIKQRHRRFVDPDDIVHFFRDGAETEVEEQISELGPNLSGTNLSGSGGTSAHGGQVSAV